MAKSEVVAGAQVTVSDETLEATPQRVLSFLRAVGTVPAIRAQLAAVGYDGGEHQRGWSLLHTVAGYDPGPAAPENDDDVIAAVNSLDAVDEWLDRLITATLKHRAPEVLARLTDGISPGRGGESVLYVRMVLTRLDALAKSPEKSVLTLLAKRGITPAKRAELAALVKTAERFGEAAPVAAVNEKHVANLRALRAWYEEWSELARAQVSRKDYLQRLGLARRKRTAPTKPAPTP